MQLPNSRSGAPLMSSVLSVDWFSTSVTMRLTFELKGIVTKFLWLAMRSLVSPMSSAKRKMAVSVGSPVIVRFSRE